ncbi:receptor-like protein 36 [Rosa rugosa]|uniref:receptor-like protein 36 n=1 Tax=Rosa rugosa TaxID=74645 RepID=UPI002B40E061|nr:receptor-like protein 36 [Rosa rugosa]
MTTLFLHFFLFLITTCIAKLIPAVHSNCIVEQQLSLLHFKKSLVYVIDPPSPRLITWNSSTDCCSWVGVTCSTNGYVVGLDLSSEFVSCRIDNSSSLFQLQHLESLNLANNVFNGSQIPSAIGELTNLRYLNLASGFYSGQIPIEISRLARLVSLDLSRNSYDGVSLKLENPNLSMLIQNLTELTELYLDSVEISGQGSDWCEAISSSLPNLRVLSLSFCGLSGPICDSLAKLQSLYEIDLGNNSFYAPVPRSFANFSNLTSLSLFGCNLLGIFPKEVFLIPSLQTIDISSNPELGGSFPEFPKNRTKLSTISLSHCNFTGSLPMSIENLTQLVGLDVSWNRFNSPISPIHWEALVNLRSLDFSNNLLYGSIPSSIVSPPLLVALALSNNHFSGQVPEFSNTSSQLLQNLLLGNNNLEGEIPTSIFNLKGLMYLDLASNNFSGFPFSGPQQPRTLSFLDLSHNSLLFDYNGTSSPFLQIENLLLASNKLVGLPDFLKNQSRLWQLDLSGNQIQGQIPNWIWRLNSLGLLNLSYNSIVNLEPLLPNSTFTLFTLDLNSNKIQGIHSSYAFLQIGHLGLASNKLRTFPDFLRNQSTLNYLDLSNNQIQGQIPNWIWRLNSLQELNLSCNSLETLEAPLPMANSSTVVTSLDLHSNQLQGQIPLFLPFAHFLDYSRNNFSSSLPTDIGSFISQTNFLSLSSNKLHGTIPRSICNTTSMVLDLSYNSLSGIIPQCLTQLSLSVLDLRTNNLTGSIPDNFLEHCKLQTLDLSRNNIQGQFPKSLVNCSSLGVLNLGNNQITDTFPCLLMTISTLRVLVLRSNNLYGSLGCPKTNNTWPVLQIIDLAHNHLNGEIPATSFATWQKMKANEDDGNLVFSYTPLYTTETIGMDVYYRDTITTIIKGLQLDLIKILTIFTLIDFSSNNFTGSIPKEIGELKALYALNLSGNAFTGEIPSSFGNMSSIESLDLSQNHLSGRIPPQLSTLTFLSHLNVSYNQLTGRIPTSTQFSTFPNTSFEGNKGLWGPPLTWDTAIVLPPPTFDGSSSNPNSGDEIDWDIISVEIGFTCGFGIAIGSLLFCKRWRKWYYRAMFNILFKTFPQLEHRFGNHRRHAYINQRYWRR